MKRGRKPCNRRKPLFVRVKKQNLLWFRNKARADAMSRSQWLDDHFDKLREKEEQRQAAAVG